VRGMMTFGCYTLTSDDGLACTVRSENDCLDVPVKEMRPGASCEKF
jgi:hypothetical protein